MTLLAPESNEVFTVRVYKSFEGYRWANTYELLSENPTSYENLRDAALTIADRERAPLSSAMRIYKVVISTYAPDSRPYNPESFATINTNLVGQAGFSPELIPLNVCAFVRRNTLTGRPGKAFYRGFLSEGDVSWGGDKFAISQTRQTQIAQVLNAMLADLLQAGFQLVLARGARTPVNVRPVTGMVVVDRTSFKKLDNRYFDVRERR